ncbi:hypothetical protein [Mycolicibacterium parafortuitum]|uniref:Uncharacterized protein n=1 Tax=Mycolicibacterium parafortuitum TaxID=39692 RepID=A0A375YBZ2_MYCPF|nr:hypothetical protein [Mycolicibacterium parafortuitum]SRX78615.1 hypothetical protein MPP7335_00342 [Mycolicibacterium parafortuitum]
MEITLHRPGTRAALFVSAALVSVGGWLAPAVAHAERIWDIQDYDSCVRAADIRFVNGQTNGATYADEVKFCCLRSGGEWHSVQHCTAPAALPGTVQSPGGLPLEAVDVGSRQRPSAPAAAPTVAADPAPPPTTVPPTVRDHRR